MSGVRSVAGGVTSVPRAIVSGPCFAPGSSCSAPSPWVEIEPGPDKVGVIDLTPGNVASLRASRLFVNVHTLSYMQGEVRGWIVPTVDAKPATWGGLKAIYR